MKIIKRFTLAIIAFSMLAMGTVEAQETKIGYINSLELLASMPESKTADQQLQTFQTQLTSEGQSKLKKLETDLAGFYEAVQKGEITPKDQAIKEAELEKQRQSLLKFEQEAQSKLLQKRETLYEPIFTKANDAITDVAKANGFTMVFDSSVGVLLHAEEGDNLISLVKTKLNIQ